jgi:sulfate adenylyltransferase subunit 2
MLRDELEDKSIYILREAFSKFERLPMLCSMGRDSTVLLWLAREAFFGHESLAPAHVDITCETMERRFRRRNGYM